MTMLVASLGGRKRIRPRGWVSGLIVTAGAALAGCQKSDSLPSLQVYEVKGQVLLANGKPLGGGWIYFVPKADLPVTPSATIQADGSFSLITGGSGEGAPAGEYKVRVEAPQLPQARPRSGVKPAIPPKYNDEDSSGLVIPVRAEANRIEPIILR